MMRLFRGYMIAVCALALAGCSSLAGAAVASDRPPIAAAGDKVIVEGARALILANATYKAVGTAAAVGIEHGLIVGDAKARVKAVSARVVAALVKGQAALSAGDKALSAAEALRGLDELCTIAPPIEAACALVK